MGNDFYIGYRKAMPPVLARFVRAAVLVIVLVVVVTAGTIGAMQEPAGDGTYDFGANDWFTVHISEYPSAPAIVRTEDGTYKPVFLVGRGKHGPSATIAAMKDQIVQFTGARITRGNVQAIEIATEKNLGAGLPVQPPPLSTAARHPVSFEGELIDTKCYLGVMKPGNGKVHRGCASLCLRGGVPPALTVRNVSGATRVIALSMRGPDAPALNPEWAGRIVRVSGFFANYSGFPVLTVREIFLR